MTNQTCSITQRHLLYAAFLQKKQHFKLKNLASFFLILSFFLLVGQDMAWGQLADAGSYPSSTVKMGKNISITPVVVPNDAGKTTASCTNTNFRGLLTVDQSTGVVRVTNAQQAGTYTIKVKNVVQDYDFNNDPPTPISVADITTFTLTVTNPTATSGEVTKNPTAVSVNTPQFVAIGDFNGDGNQDLAVSNNQGNAVSIRLGDGQGGFSGTTEVSAGSVPAGIAIGDFNGDGYQDLAVCNARTSGTVSIRLGDGQGGFSGTTAVSVGAYPNAVAIGDFNRDGHQDFAVTGGNSSGKVSIGLGNGDGTFSSTIDVSVGSYPNGVAIGDFNGDGYQDLAVSNSSSVSIRLGDGMGGFSGTTDVSVGSTPNGVAIGDFNGDGYQDFAVANKISSGTVSIRLGDGMGGFSGTTAVSVGARPNGVAIGDFNGDGKQDLAVSNSDFQSSTVSIRLGDGMGGFSGTTDVSATSNTVAIGDFNGDCKQDLATISGNSVSILLGSGGPPPVINVQGNSTDIADGDTSPSTEDDTDFGTGTEPITRTFTIQNTGAGELTISSIVSSNTRFSIFGAPTSVAAGSSATFDVAFEPIPGDVVENATITINSNDAGKAMYDFAVKWSLPPPTLGSYAATSVTAGKNTSITPSSVPTDATSIVAYSTNTNFKGGLTVNPTTGVVRVTDALQAGTYTITVKAFGTATATATFTLTVTDPACSQAGLGSSSRVSMPVGTNPQAVAVGDFNGDGNQDLAVPKNYSSGKGSISILLGDGQGGFSGTTDVSVGSYLNGVAIGDFNGDGNQDLAVVDGASGSVRIRLGDGQGGFSGTTAVSVGSNPRKVAIGDFNGDGKQDLAVVNNVSNTVSIRLGDGNGNFSGTTDVSVGSSPSSVAIGDFDRDGDQDLAVANNVSSSVSIRLGDGNGNFSGMTDVSMQYNPEFVAIGDFNGDGKQDLAVAKSGGQGTFSIRLGDGNGDFTGTTEVSAGVNNPRLLALAIGDFNGDGKQDLAVTDASSRSVLIRLGDGQGGFSGTTAVSVGSNPSTVAIGDFNGDGHQDFAVANTYSDYVSILLLGGTATINVQGNNTDIADGDISASYTDDTDFGTAVARTFTIQNTGNAALTISSIVSSNPAFVVSGVPGSVPARSSGSFDVAFTASMSNGDPIQSATITINSDDCNKGAYDFVVSWGLSAPVVPQNGASTVACLASATPPKLPTVMSCDGSSILTPSGPTIVDDPSSIACEGTRTYTYTYNCSIGSSTWSYVYTIEREPFTVPADGSSTVACLANATRPTLPVVTSNCGETLTPATAVITDSPSSLTCEGTRTYAYTYTDCEGNTATWSYVYTIEREPFTVPANGSSTVACLANATTPTLPTVTSNCGETLTPAAPVITDSPSSLTCEGTRTYAYTYTDCEGNTATWRYVYTIEREPFTVPANGLSTVACLANATTPTLPTVTSNCGETLTPAQAVITDSPSSLTCEGTRTYAYAYTDCEGNTATWRYVYTIDYSGGLTAPNNATATVSCPAEAVDPGAPADITDACGRTVSAVLVGQDAVSPACEGTVVWRYRYTACDGTTTADWTKTYTIDYSGGLTAPNNTTATVSCPAEAVDPGTPADITDACGRTVSAVLIGQDAVSPACEGTVVWRYRYTACDGTTTADWTKIYTIEREPFTVPADRVSTVACLANATAPALPTVTSNCGETLTPSAAVITDSPSSLTCEGTRTYAYAYTDCEGNTATWSYVYTIEREPFTVPANGSSTVACLANATTPTLPTVTSNCGETLTPAAHVITDSPSSLTCEGTRTYAYTYTDCEGNTATWRYVYTIEREPFTVPANGSSTVACLANATTPTLPTVTSNCGETLTPAQAVITDSPSSLTCEGTRTYAYAYTDCEGNTATWSYVYTIEREPFTVPADGSSTVACLANATRPTLPVVKSNCGEILTPVSTRIADSTSYLIIWRTYSYTYKDCEGNIAIWHYVYFIELKPFTVPADGAKTVQCLSDAKLPTPPTVKNSCGEILIPSGVVVTTVPSSPDADGTITYTWTYIDGQANFKDWNFVYTIKDNASTSTRPLIKLPKLPTCSSSSVTPGVAAINFPIDPVSCLGTMTIAFKGIDGFSTTLKVDTSLTRIVQDQDTKLPSDYDANWRFARIMSDSFQVTINKLPAGSYVLIVMIRNECGNLSAPARIPFVVGDCKAPVPICINGLSTDLMPILSGGGAMRVFAKDFIAKSVYDCNGQGPDNKDGLKLITKYSVNCLGKTVSKDSIGITVTCADAGKQIPVEIHAWDEIGNHDFCVTYLNVNDSKKVCPSNLGGGEIAGLIQTEAKQSVQGVTVELSGKAVMNKSTASDGKYSFTGLEKGYDYTVTPSLDANPLNGVSTFDMVLIQKHILGNQPLDSPYKLIAADINNSRSISTMDLIMLRKLILNLDTKFTSNTSWHLVDAAYRFPNPSNPWSESFPEISSINNLSGKASADFVAVKIGDVNGNASPTSAAAAEPRKAGKLELSTEEQRIEGGQEYRVEIRAKDLKTIEGYQFTLELDKNKVDLVDIDYGVAKAEHFGIFQREGIITTSWNRKGGSENNDAVLFTLHLQGKGAAKLSEALTISSRYTANEAYQVGGDYLNVAMSYTKPVVLNDQPELLQNTPNPFSDQTQIGFYLPQATEGRLTIRDAKGSIVYRLKAEYNKGWNQVTIKQSDLKAAGVLYYTLETPDFIGTKKMVVVNR